MQMADGSARLGRYTVDPKNTDFIVLPNEIPQPNKAEEESALPDWAIAVIVIGLGSIAFVVIFGITVVRNLFVLDSPVNRIYRYDISDSNISNRRNNGWFKHFYNIVFTCIIYLFEIFVLQRFFYS